MGCIVNSTRAVNGVIQNATAIIRSDTLASDNSKYKQCVAFIDLLEQLDVVGWHKENKIVRSAEILDDGYIKNLNYVATANIVFKNLTIPNFSKTIIAKIDGLNRENFVAKIDAYIGGVTDNVSGNLYNHTNVIVTNIVFEIA